LRTAGFTDVRLRYAHRIPENDAKIGGCYLLSPGEAATPEAIFIFNLQASIVRIDDSGHSDLTIGKTGSTGTCSDRDCEPVVWEKRGSRSINKPAPTPSVAETVRIGR